MPEPLVSVVVPAYNAAATIADTLASVLAQSHGALDVVVVDDGSTDATARVVAAIGDSRLRLLRRPNGGVAVARNAGIDAARGDFVAFVDADDLWRPDKIAAQLAALEAAGPRAGLAYCWSALIDESGRLTGGHGCAGRHAGDVLAPLAAGNFVGNASAALVRREVLRGVRFSASPPGSRGAEDWQFYLEVAAHWPFALVPRFLVGYRLRPDSMSRGARAMIASHRHVAALTRRRHPELGGAPFRWAEAGLHLWLARRAADGDAGLAMLALLARAVACDPARLASPTTGRMLALALRCLASRFKRLAVPPRPRALLPYFLEAEVPAPPPAPSADWLERHRLRWRSQPCAAAVSGAVSSLKPRT